MNKKLVMVSKPKKQAQQVAPEETPDLELVRAFQAGDDEAFGKLVARYQRKVYSVALSMVKNPEDAMDIAQDAFIKVHRYLGGFQGSSSFYTWLYRIVVNLCIDHLRRAGKRIQVDFDERMGNQNQAAEGTAMVASRQDVDPGKMLGRKELAEHIREAVEALPPYHRAVIVMREIDGMSYAEIAKAMNVSKGTVMSRLHHARQKLQKSLGEYLSGDLTVE